MVIGYLAGAEHAWRHALSVDKLDSKTNNQLANAPFMCTTLFGEVDDHAAASGYYGRWS